MKKTHHHFVVVGREAEAATTIMLQSDAHYDHSTAGQKITIALSDYTATNLVGLSTNGWYFPSGM